MEYAFLKFYCPIPDSMRSTSSLILMMRVLILMGLMTACADSERRMTADMLREKEEKVSKYLDSLELYTNIDISQEQALNKILIKYSTQFDTTDLYDIEDFGLTLRFLRKANGRVGEVIKEGNLTRNQLESLEKDIRNGFYSDEEYLEYSSIEDSAAEVFMSDASGLLKIYKRNLPKLETTKPLADSLVESLNRRGYR